MAGNEHVKIKPEQIAATAAEALESQLVLPAAFQRETFDAYKGQKNDTVNVRVKGVLPWHTKDFRFDRDSDPGLTYDLYSERTYGVKLGKWGYSAVAMTAEQRDFDFTPTAELSVEQGEAVGKGINAEAALYAADDSIYDIIMGVDSAALDNGLVKIRQNLRKCKVDTSGLVAFVGADWEAALSLDDRLNLASNVGDSMANSAFGGSTLGSRRGFRFVVCDELDDDDMIVMSGGSFVFANAAPTKPNSAPFAANASSNGVSLMWVKQWNHDKLRDESVFSTWYGFRHLTDPIISTYLDAQGLPQRKVSDSEYFVRAFKVKLDGVGSFSSTSGDLTIVSGLGSEDLTVTGSAPAAPSAWTASTTYEVGDTVTDGSAVLRATKGGVSGSTEPVAPGVGNTVTDGDITWYQIA